MKKSIAFGLFLVTSLAQAALPPQFQRSREIVAVVQDPVVMNLVVDPRYKDSSSHMIDCVKVNGSFEGGVAYLITSGDCSFTARVIYQPSPHPGPVLFKVVSDTDMECEN